MNMTAERKAEVARFATRLASCRIPSHLAVIPDGNRRWAAGNGMEVMKGHRRGFEVAKRLSRFCRDIGIHTVTVWAFSTENWRRSPEEVSYLMALYEEWLTDLLGEAIEEEVRVVHLGRKQGLPIGSESAAAAAGFPKGLPDALLQAIVEIEEKTRSFENNLINLAINYGGEDEVRRAFATAARTSAGGEADITMFLDTAAQPHPNPDIVWRTSGEVRTSGFLPLQSVYAELVFTDKLFPELDEEDVVATVEEYSARVRRFGG